MNKLCICQLEYVLLGCCHFAGQLASAGSCSIDRLNPLWDGSFVCLAQRKPNGPWTSTPDVKWLIAREATWYVLGNSARLALFHHGWGGNCPCFPCWKCQVGRHISVWASVKPYQGLTCLIAKEWCQPHLDTHCLTSWEVLYSVDRMVRDVLSSFFPSLFNLHSSVLYRENQSKVVTWIYTCTLVNP